MPNPTNASQAFSLARIQGFLSSTYKSQFVRNVAVVASGTAGAQAITMAFAPIITRLYGPEAFGLQGTFIAIAAVVMPIAALCYPIAIVLPKKDGDARGIARLSAYIALSMTVLAALVLLIAGDLIVELLHLNEIRSYIMLIPLVIVFSAWLQINYHWLIRKKQFKINARVAVLQAFLTNSAKAGIGLFSPQASVLILVYTLGSGLQAFMLSIGIKKTENGNDKDKLLCKTPLRQLAKKYYDFPMYRAPQIFLNTVSQSIPIIMLAAFFGPASAGCYGLGKGLLGMPSELISKSVGDVFYPRITTAANSGEKLTNLILKATLGLAAVGFIPFALVIAFGPWLFGFIFGSEWFLAGEYARWLALWMFSAFINRPSVVSMPVLSLQGFFLIYEILSVVLRIITLIIGFYMLKSDILAIMLFSMAGVFLNIAIILLTIYKSLFQANIKVA